LRASNYDYLTGLPSMAYFFDLAEAARNSMVKRGEDPVLLFIDLSGMKFYNRKHGYSKGDELLVSFAHLLTRYFSNERCCRIGEDHFAVVTDRDGIEERLNRLFEEWKEIRKGDALAVRVGIYRNSMEKVDASSACDRAKYACDSLRNNYTSCICWFDEDMLYEARGRQYIIENIDKAIEENWITVYYQAIVRSTNGKVCDEEALARWIDPERGMMSPAVFVPVLEEAGLIYKLDLFVVEQVLKKIKMMRDMGLKTSPVSVNLSRRDFEKCDIIDEICRRVDEAGFDHDVINIEITESTVARDVDYMKAQVERFRELGFHVWMDDFGSGYSSLDVLQTIKFDLIKFDMHFMQQFDNGDEARIILTELMKMASSLGVETICEGVEREDQVQFLREIGCSKIQGFYYERPISLEDLLKKFDGGSEIGTEDPDEKEYYEAIGRINLYDLSMIANSDDSSLKHYFNTLPMAIIEVNGEKARFARSNQSYREFIRNLLGVELPGNIGEFRKDPKWIRPWFLEKIRECCETKNSMIVDENRPDNTTIHTFLRKIGTNPVTGTSAVAVAVLSISDTGEDITYANIARALAADYFSLFYVDFDTEEFIEFKSDAGV
ncbi:MAG: bifunctional diguanylate cyclase/phosphodiesterase, partial [Erysipelotrichaceae bacterium]|nr:bifunctional diguanylate cyclase/phosphodiesterase [Erysipelotrichaceae bacterium]